MKRRNDLRVLHTTMRQLVRWAFVFFLTSTLVCVLGGAASAYPSGAAGARRNGVAAVSVPRVLSCTGKALLKPKSYVIYCADANAILKNMHWVAWGKVSAVARGTLSENDCTPNCAAGKFRNYSATARLNTPIRTKYGLFFSELLVTYKSGTKTKLLQEPLPIKPI